MVGETTIPTAGAIMNRGNPLTVRVADQTVMRSSDSATTGGVLWKKTANAIKAVQGNRILIGPGRCSHSRQRARQHHCQRETTSTRFGTIVARG